MPEISVNGIVTYFQQNKKSKGKYPFVIFIHGAAQSSVCWEFQYNLSDTINHYNFIFIDLPGHGKSEGVGFSTIKDYSDFLHTFINKMNIEEYVLVGHSMGGRISQVNLIDHPRHAIGSVLVGSGSRIRVTRHTRELAKKSIIDFADMASENSFSDMASAGLKTEFKNHLLNTRQETIVNDLKACNEFDTTDNLSEINVQTYIIAGEKDKLAPIHHSLHLRNSIANSKLEIIKGAGHFMMLEKPVEFNRAISGFLNYL